ncbi:MAG: hypothetical protein CBD16_03430 [Betaproteobacteria bacterium TMED156]|nr:MAG: hypothetical protein CBD16_03430 [Betaproteobacteria bacterium TMED156]
MSKQPKLVAWRDGQTWLVKGFNIFKKQPLIWIFSLFTYWVAMFLFGLIPLLGLIVSLILSPGIAFGFIALARAIDEDRTLFPKLIISGFTGPHLKPMLLLGVLYIFAVLIVLFISVTADGGSLLTFIIPGELSNQLNADDSKKSSYGAIVAVITYIPVMMSFWFAPQLVAWHKFSASKAIFYSFFAVWLNRKSFLFYGITWFSIILTSVLIMGILSNIFTGVKQLIAFGILPLSLIFMAIAHGSYYASTKSVFMNINENKKN